MIRLEEKIKAKAVDLGYDACGIIKVDSFEEYFAQLDIRSGLFPHSAGFYNRYRKMLNPKSNLTWAASIIVCLRRYDKYRLPNGLSNFFGKIFLVDGRASHSQEYLNKQSFEQFLKDLGMRAEQNVAPARWSAVKAGLAKFRNNNFIYTKQGSWNWIDTWVVDRPLEYENKPDSHRFVCPEGCSKCINACPTGALCAPLTMDPTRCIAYLSFSPGSFPSEELRERMGSWLYGCDLCQDACPANVKTWQKNDSYFPEPMPLENVMTPEKILTMDEKLYRSNVQPRFFYIGENDFWQWKCNALRVLANLNAKKYREHFARALDDSNEKVREVATWALERTDD